MSQVEETLKSTRIVHRMLTLVCATVLGVALYPSEEKDYSAAVAEVDAIAKINFDKFINSSVEQVKSLAKGMDLAEAYQRAFDSAIRHELEQEGFIPPASQPLNHEVFLPAFDGDYVRTLLHRGTIQHYRDFISENMGVEYVFVEPEQLARAFVSKMQDANIPPTSEIGGMKLVMSPPVYTKHTPKSFRLKMLLMFTVPEPNLGSYLLVVEDPPVSLVDTFDETRFQDWLGKQKLLDRLTEHNMLDGQHDGPESIFPQLRSVWSLVANKVPEEAKRVLLEEVKKSRRTISFLGVEIDASMVVVAGPGFALLLFLNLLSYAGHLQRISKTDKHSFCTFPWLPLFQDTISRAVSFASILILPVVAFGWSLFRFWHIGATTLCIAIGVTALCAVSAYFTWSRILALRKMCEGEKGRRS